LSGHTDRIAGICRNRPEMVRRHLPRTGRYSARRFHCTGTGLNFRWPGIAKGRFISDLGFISQLGTAFGAMLDLARCRSYFACLAKNCFCKSWKTCR
jgi:hypothetical protein